MTDDEQDGYMDKDTFVNGMQQAVFLQNFSRERDENIETFDLTLIGNFFPGRMIFFKSLATSYDTLEIKVSKACPDELLVQLNSKYKHLGCGFVSILKHKENIHIIITVKKDTQEEIIGHLCCRFAVENKFFCCRSYGYV